MTWFIYFLRLQFMRKSKTTIAEAKANYERVYEITTLQYFKQCVNSSSIGFFSGSLLAEKGPCRLCKQLKIIMGAGGSGPSFQEKCPFWPISNAALNF